jgi:pimeloyl-ACP methyl ester carboxylesterase
MHQPRKCGPVASLALVLAACGTRQPSAQRAATTVEIAPVVLAVASASSSVELPVPAMPAAPPSRVITGDEVTSLEVPGFRPAVVRVPVGAAPPRPVVIATHGNFDRPEWQCEVWSRVFRHSVFVVCPRGSPAYGATDDDPRFTYSDGVSLEREIDADLAAMRASNFANDLADGPPVYASFSLGAILGAGLAIRRPADFPALILVEGGLDKLDDTALRVFVKRGGARMMFVCAQGGCAGPATLLANRLKQLGGDGVVVDAGRVGHTYDSPVADAVAKALPAFLAADERFRGLLDD